MTVSRTTLPSGRPRVLVLLGDTEHAFSIADARRLGREILAITADVSDDATEWPRPTPATQETKR